MDALTLLKNDHKTVEKLFKRFEKAEKSGGEDRKAIVDEVVRELSMHAAVEEQVFYPAVREGVEEAEDVVLEGLEEHHIVKWTLSELDGMSADHERFNAKMSVLIESVRHHVEEEEGEMFPKVRSALGRKRLAEIGALMEQAKQVAPTKPHPRQPDEPPGNLVTGLSAAVVDRAVDVAKGATAAAADKVTGRSGGAAKTTAGKRTAATKSAATKSAAKGAAKSSATKAARKPAKKSAGS
ncbi:MAG TPA: hemerythrin domain-containing protein [Mycobacteriales bacterium]|nr:hemerythrin domain-containing protein [Mycobacteriales bacterium]